MEESGNCQAASEFICRACRSGNNQLVPRGALSCGSFAEIHFVSLSMDGCDSLRCPWSSLVRCQVLPQFCRLSGNINLRHADLCLVDIWFCIFQFLFDAKTTLQPIGLGRLDRTCHAILKGHQRTPIAFHYSNRLA